MMSKSISIQIDGQTLECQPGENIIEVADRNGI